MDKIILRNLEIQGIIGVYAWERTTLQTICISLELTVDLRAAGASDDINQSVDYAALADQVRRHASTAARLTIEALAEDISHICLQDPRVASALVRVEKPGAVPGAQYAAVEIVRSRPPL